MREGRGGVRGRWEGGDIGDGGGRDAAGGKGGRPADGQPSGGEGGWRRDAGRRWVSRAGRPRPQYGCVCFEKMRAGGLYLKDGLLYHGRCK